MFGKFKYRLYCYFHNKAKQLLGKANLTSGNILKIPELKFNTQLCSVITLWDDFIKNSVILGGEYDGFLHAGYIAECNEWCLPSWIWTNAAIIREKCLVGKIQEAESLATLIAKKQQKCGGWVVRNDYDKQGPIPMLAPNDSAYIANNAFIKLFEITDKIEYLEIAIKCADWIIKTARPDGMVYVGYNMRNQKWVKNCVIVDVGFTAGLFANLARITNEKKYIDFLKHFIDRYIDLFYIPSKHGFCTSIDKEDHQQGGMFGRGQAWALEGLIPAYLLLKDKRIRLVIEETINNLINVQCSNGSWAYNLTKPLMGEDCKAVSVIAKNMMDWYQITLDERIFHSAKKALDWCRLHTLVDGEAKGGIFSFCMEGAIVQNLYTSCAFVYASAYAIELEHLLKR